MDGLTRLAPDRYHVVVARLEQGAWLDKAVSLLGAPAVEVDVYRLSLAITRLFRRGRWRRYAVTVREGSALDPDELSRMLTALLGKEHDALGLDPGEVTLTLQTGEVAIGELLVTVGALGEGAPISVSPGHILG